MATRSLQKPRLKPVSKTEPPAGKPDQKARFSSWASLHAYHMEEQLEGLDNMINGLRVLDNIDGYDARYNVSTGFEICLHAAVANLKAAVSELAERAEKAEGGAK